MTAPWISPEHNNDRLAGTLLFLERGPAAAKVLLLDGTRPAGGGALTNVLAAISLADPPGSLVSNKLVLAPAADALVLLDGTATWARVINGDGTAALDCDVSDMTGGAPIRLLTTALLAGGAVRLTVAEFT
ncbi:hypothetical protein HNQ51_001710 [Inhella inkyongensis]|uniref:Uncharacterized protein n=1 Tax=Inhella inkyongensis TaxID=392593 RepID=A0A840S5V9_9BURK|nr:hypothetical protein [Inhella inkyongensis]MBB5204396.1 hypothetical protein [Inhella inkyongensis]